MIAVLTARQQHLGAVGTIVSSRLLVEILYMLVRSCAHKSARVRKQVWCSHLYYVVMLWPWKAAISSAGFPPSPGFPEASPGKAKSLAASHATAC